LFDVVPVAAASFNREPCGS